jgi:energy-coupling factor transporter transmembrane protein EcfT
MDQYPAIKLIVERGNLLAIVIGLLPFAGGVVAVVSGMHWLLLIAGAVSAAVVYLLMRSYVELVRVMADMLIPK